MSSTSNKNTLGDYTLEQNINNSISNHMTYIHNASGLAYTNHLAGNGLLMGKNAPETLCNNYCDIESQLRGIGSSNLVIPKKEILPELKYNKSLSISERLPTIVPESIQLDKDQRPFPLP
tara:strand:- start:639 stop:998 length:360 start_codon:yes stop_codon:yes gene_type:complete